MRQALMAGSVMYIGVFIVVSMIELIRLKRALYFYGVQNGKMYYKSHLHKRFFIPSKGSKKYISYQKKISSVGWGCSVEQFYFLKHILAFGIMLMGLLILQTNLKWEIQGIKEDMQYMQNGAKYADYPKEAVEKESQLVDYIGCYLEENPKKLRSDSFKVFLQERLEKMTFIDEDSEQLTIRLLEKLKAIQNLKADSKGLTCLWIATYLVFYVPDLLLWIKRLLASQKREWQFLSCLATYMIIGHLPPYKLEAIVTEINQLEGGYGKQIHQFYEALVSQQQEVVSMLIDEADQDLGELFENIDLAYQNGVKGTIESVDDLFDSKSKWLEITATRRRKKKIILVYVPVTVLLILLFQYMMYGMMYISTHTTIRF